MHYGQARVRATDEGEPVRMWHRVSPQKSWIQYRHPDPDERENIQYDVDLDTGAVEIPHAINVAKMYTNGWPLQIAEIDPEHDIALEARPAEQVAMDFLSSMPIHTLRIYAQGLGVSTVIDERQMRTLVARRIDDPWTAFGVKPQMQRRVDLKNLPPFLVFPRPDLALHSDLDDDPFWSYIPTDIVMELKASVADSHTDAYWSWHYLGIVCQY